MSLLNLVLAIPAVGFNATLLLPRDNHSLIRNFTLAVSLLVFVLSLGLISPVLENPGQMSFVTDVPWIEYPLIRYHVGLHGLTLWLVIHSTHQTPLCI